MSFQIKDKSLDVKWKVIPDKIERLWGTGNIGKTLKRRQ